MTPAACVMGNTDLRLICSSTCFLARTYPPTSHAQARAVTPQRVQLPKWGAKWCFVSWMYTFNLLKAQVNVKTVTPAKPDLVFKKLIDAFCNFPVIYFTTLFSAEQTIGK